MAKLTAADLLADGGEIETKPQRLTAADLLADGGQIETEPAPVALPTSQPPIGYLGPKAKAEPQQRLDLSLGPDANTLPAMAAGAANSVLVGGAPQVTALGNLLRDRLAQQSVAGPTTYDDELDATRQAYNDTRKANPYANLLGEMAPMVAGAGALKGLTKSATKVGPTALERLAAKAKDLAPWAAYGSARGAIATEGDAADKLKAAAQGGVFATLAGAAPIATAVGLGGKGLWDLAAADSPEQTDAAKEELLSAVPLGAFGLLGKAGKAYNKRMTRLDEARNRTQQRFIDADMVEAKNLARAFDSEVSPIVEQIAKAKAEKIKQQQAAGGAQTKNIEADVKAKAKNAELQADYTNRLNDALGTAKQKEAQAVTKSEAKIQERSAMMNRLLEKAKAAEDKAVKSNEQKLQLQKVRDYQAALKQAVSEKATANKADKLFTEANAPPDSPSALSGALSNKALGQLATAKNSKLFDNLKPETQELFTEFFGDAWVKNADKFGDTVRTKITDPVTGELSRPLWEAFIAEESAKNGISSSKAKAFAGMTRQEIANKLMADKSMTLEDRAGPEVVAKLREQFKITPEDLQAKRVKQYVPKTEAELRADLQAQKPLPAKYTPKDDAALLKEVSSKVKRKTVSSTDVRVPNVEPEANIAARLLKKDIERTPENLLPPELVDQAKSKTILRDTPLVEEPVRWDMDRRLRVFAEKNRTPDETLKEKIGHYVKLRFLDSPPVKSQRRADADVIARDLGNNEWVKRLIAKYDKAQASVDLPASVGAAGINSESGDSVRQQAVRMLAAAKAKSKSAYDARVKWLKSQNPALAAELGL